MARTSWVAGIAPDVRATSWQPHLRLQFTSSRLIDPVHLIGYMSEAEHRSAARLRIHALTAIVQHDDVSGNPADRYGSDPIGETRILFAGLTPGIGKLLRRRLQSAIGIVNE